MSKDATETDILNINDSINFTGLVPFLLQLTCSYSKTKHVWTCFYVFVLPLVSKHTSLTKATVPCNSLADSPEKETYSKLYLTFKHHNGAEEQPSDMLYVQNIIFLKTMEKSKE